MQRIYKQCQWHAYDLSFRTGAAMTASIGDNSVRSPVENDSDGSTGFHLHAADIKSSFSADIFGSVAFTAQHGNFQRLFSDLTRFHARLDFPSGSKFLSGATRLAQDYFNSQRPSLETVQAVCPKVFFSVQQQVLVFLLDLLVHISIVARCFY